MSDNTHTNQHPLGPNAALYKIQDDGRPRKCKLESSMPELRRMDIKIPEALGMKSEELGEELLAGFEAIAQYPQTVTFFGSARTPAGTKEYEDARRLAGKIAQEGYAVLTGGGPGIMEAANRGAQEVCGYSLGFNINLPFEQNINPYVTHGLDFDYFSARKMAMFFSAEAYVYCPGGFGTLDEFFQLVTLIQTKKAPKTPIVLFGSAYWKPIDALIRKTLLEDFKAISPEDLDLYIITDNDEEVLEIIRNAPERGQYE